MLKHPQAQCDLFELLRQNDSFRLTFRFAALVGINVAAKRNNIVGEDSRPSISHDGSNVLRFPRDFCLLAERLELTSDFSRQVVEAREVGLHRFELANRLLFASPVFENSRCFFNEPAAVLGCCLQDGVEASLTDNDVHLSAETRIRQQFLNIEQAARFTVDGVLALSTAEKDSRNRDFRILNRQRAVGIVNREHDLGTAKRAPGRRSREDDIFHFSATEGFCALFTHHPSESINDVRLARTVGTDNGGHSGLKVKGGRLCERLEALESQGLQVHGFYYP